ncbi:MAG: hypothetical protein Kow0089_03600 [Desulfobulbaceae bacterium]
MVLLAVRPVAADDIGELDTTFGEDGKVITSFGRFGDQAYSVALQSDGKILAAGSASNGDNLDLAIARYNEDGSLDTSFGREGKVWTSILDGDEEINAIRVQDDGPIVAAGYTQVEGGRDFLLVRFTPDGDFDTSFGREGVVITELGNQDDEITAMTIDGEGRIVVCGYVTGTAGRVVALARYLDTGELDETFGDGGMVLSDVGDDALARSIDIDDKDRLVIAGSYYHAERTELMLLRYSDSGELDSGFGRNGIAVPADREQATEGYGVRLLEDGRILVAGSVGGGEDRDAALFRFHESGEPDESFGAHGRLITSDSDEDDMALAIDVIDNVVGLSGYSTFNTKRDFLFVSVEEQGDEGTNIALNMRSGGFTTGGTSYDGVFDLEGRQVQATSEDGEDETAVTNSVFSITALGYTDDVSYAVVLQPDGKAVSVGFTDQDGISRFAVARYVTPVANATGTAVDNQVSWIMTKEPTNVNRTGAFTGGTILDSGLTITQRGVVFSIAPDPVYKGGDDAGNNPDPNNPDDGNNGNDTTPPVVTISEPTAGETIDAGTTSVALKVTTNEAAVCKYAEADVDYDSMEEFPAGTTTDTTFEVSLTVTDGTSYTYYVRCRDISGNESPAASVTFSVASARSGGVPRVEETASVVVQPETYRERVEPVSTPAQAREPVVEEDGQESSGAGPVITDGTPNGTLAAGSSLTYISVRTSVAADCRYSTGADEEFDVMSGILDTADNLSHIARVEGLEDDHTYSFYVRCRSLEGEDSGTPYRISFRVADTGDYAARTYRVLRDVFGRFLVTPAHAQTTTTTTSTDTTATGTTDSSQPSSVFDLTAPAYAEEGSTDDGGGVGSYSSILKDLKPGTFYYVRAYAVDSSGKVYYGNQVGFKTADACFVATAAYGSILHPHVRVLRDFRDRYLAPWKTGRALVDLYYRYSPPAADFIAERPVLRAAARVVLLPVIGMSWVALHAGVTLFCLLLAAGVAMILLIRSRNSVAVKKDICHQ